MAWAFFPSRPPRRWREAGRFLQLHGVAALSREMAHALAHDDGILELGVATLKTDVATALAKHRLLKDARARLRQRG